VLIRDLVLQAPRPLVILGSSGSPSGRSVALAAGADGFLEKPVDSLGAFQAALLGRQAENDEAWCGEPDPLALRDDLQRAAERLAEGPDVGTRRYLAGFVHGLARLTRDAGLAEAAERCAAPGGGVDGLQRAIALRLAAGGAAFERPSGA